MKGTKIGNKKWKSLDSICTSSLKFRSKFDKDIVLSINSIRFLSDASYQLQMQNNQYAKEGMLEQAWEYIYQKKWKQAQLLIDKALTYPIPSSSLYFAKFVVMLFEGEEAIEYLKKSIEMRENSSKDDEYRIILSIYSKIDPDSDLDLLIDLLAPSKPIMAFHKNSYNRYYLDFLDLLSNGRYEEANDTLEKCFQMKSDYFYLEILKHLLNKLLKKEEELKKKQIMQEKELEKKRFQKFVDFVKDKDYEEAKKQIELIICYRDKEGKNNYVYQLLLELLEMILAVEKDDGFDIPDISYSYHHKKDLLYTFYETIANGDFKKTLEIGKKCRGKVLDPSEPKFKISLYITILEDFFEKLEEKKKVRDHLYYRIKSNIRRGHYIHAFEIYDKNKIAIQNYQENLIEDLFQCGISIEKKEFSFHQGPLFYEAENEELEEIPVEVKNQDSLIEEEVISKLGKPKNSQKEVEKVLEEEALEKIEPLIVEPEEKKTEKLEDTKAEPFYPVEPLLNHMEPNHPYFLNHLRCFQQASYEEAKYWLTQYGGLLRANRLEKRLDHYYYRVEMAYMESLEDPNLLQKKEELYQYAYSAMRNYEYERAITYLDYYEKMDTCRNTKAPILKGVCYSKIGKYGKAIQCFIVANSVSPNPDSYYFLGELYYKQKRWQDAIFCYLTYNEFYSKENITVYLNLSECYRRLGNYDKVLKYLKLADEIGEEQGTGMNLKGRILRAEMLNEQKKEKLLLEKEEIE